MKTTQERLDELKREYEQKQQEVIKREGIENALRPYVEGYQEPRVHFVKLYGVNVWVTIEGTRYKSIKQGKAPDGQLLDSLLKQFRPMPVMKVKDGCTSFRPDTEDNNAEIEAQTERGGKVDVYDCHGVFVEIELYQSQTASFNWYAELGEQLVKFSVSFPLHQTDLGALTLRYNYYGGHQLGKVSSVEVCEFRPYHDGQRVRWASGSPDVPNRFTIYWDKDTGSKLDFARLAEKGPVVDMRGKDKGDSL